MRHHMAHDPRAFFTLAQMATRTTQKELGEMLGISRRTAQRYSDHGVPHPYNEKLARLVHPHNRELAIEIARHAGATLVSLGLEAPPAAAPPPAPVAAAAPPPPPPLDDGVVDAVVCAAAEAKDAKPGEVRTMLLAAFSRARQIGIDTAFVERVLRAQLGLPPAPIAAPPGAEPSPASRAKGATRVARGT
jgi:hypothetical protein